MKIAHFVEELESKYAFKSEGTTDEVNNNSESWIMQKEELLLQIHSNDEAVKNTDISFRSDSQLRASRNRDIKLNALVDENESNDITKVVTGILNKTESMIAKSFKTIKTSEKTSKKGQQCSTQDVLVQVIKPLPKKDFDHRQFNNDTAKTISSVPYVDVGNESSNLNKKSDLARIENTGKQVSIGKSCIGVEKNPVGKFQNQVLRNPTPIYEPLTVEKGVISANAMNHETLDRPNGESVSLGVMELNIESENVLTKSKNENNDNPDKFLKADEVEMDFSDNLDQNGCDSDDSDQSDTLNNNSAIIALQKEIKKGRDFDELFRMLIEVIANYHQTDKTALEQSLSFQSLDHHKKGIVLVSLAKLHDSTNYELPDTKSVMNVLLSYIEDESVASIVLANYLKTIIRKDQAELLILMLKNREIDIETIFQNFR